MEPYAQIFPDAAEPDMTLELNRKVGRVPKGSYAFLECYCTDPGCDCRRTTLLVINEKGKQKAAINFGFDLDREMAGPFLDLLQEQAPYAEELLDFFVDAINSDTEWLAGMYQRYRAVRRKVDGKPYRGKAFPKPGKAPRRATPAPDLEAELERMFGALAAAPPPKSKRAKPEQGSLFDARDPFPSARAANAAAAQGGMAQLLDHYLLNQRTGGLLDALPLQNELRRYLLSNDRAGEEIAELVATSFDEEERGEAALRLLYDALEILRVDLERRRSGSQQSMARLQEALSRHVFLESGDPDLCASVTHALLQSRVEILPVLHQANQRRMLEEAERSELFEATESEVSAGLFRSIEEMGIASPFEGVEALLRLFALGEPGLQIKLAAEMMAAPSPLIREIAALLLFHPSAEVRLGVAGELAQCDGPSLTPDTLRRLIVARNWFGAEIRNDLDRAIANARRARVECAPLARSMSLQVYASVMDGAGAQSFQVIVPDGKGFSSCSLLLKQGVGVADAFVVPLKNKRELKDFLAMMTREAAFLESTPEYLDQRVCHALAEGARLGKAPSFWLVRIAEMLGRDQWKGVELEPQGELARLRRELDSLAARLLSGREAQDALDDSTDWPLMLGFADSWFEDDAVLDRAVEGVKGSRKKRDPWAPLDRILDHCLSERRELWLERLVITALWLRSAKKPPLPWHRMFHVAEALADRGRPLKEIPLMVAIAEASFAAYLGRQDAGR